MTAAPSAGEFRRCPLSGYPVVVAPVRAERPSATRTVPEPPDDPDECPFCPGREDRTPPETFALREVPADPAAWTVRAFGNRYPAATPDAAAAGRHEVVVATRRHAATLGTLTAAERFGLLLAWRRRLAAFHAEGRWRTAFVFHNQGAAAGASQRHPHSQAVALPFLGPDDPQRWGVFSAADPLGGMIAEERRAGVRMVADDGRIVAWCPHASRFPGECWLAPAEAAADGPEEFAAALAGPLGQACAALEAEAPACNLLLNVPPPGQHGRWLLRIVPRVAGIAGLELGTGIYVNPVAPEAAAARLRSRWRAGNEQPGGAAS